MTIGEIIKTNNGLRYLVDAMEIQSAPGRRMLYATKFSYKTEIINSRINKIKHILPIIKNTTNSNNLHILTNKLMQVKDIHKTIEYIAQKNVKDDIELFEIKHFALLTNSIKEMVELLKINVVKIPDLNKMIDILDPDNKRIPHFHIYKSYSLELAQLIVEYKKLKANNQHKEAEQLYLQCVEQEDKIREKLSEKLRPYAEELKTALNNIAELDVIIAKAKLADKYKLSYPQPSKTSTKLKGMFNPQIADILQQQGKQYQPIDIEIPIGSTLITGANMAGKSVVLKTTALIQYLMQFGFYVPCKQANIKPVEQIIISMGDEQNEMKGLSSFAAEMLKISKTIDYANENKNMLVLIDELASTTNPDEGKAIVNGVVELLDDKNVMALITTHYSGINAKCYKLRVKGFKKNTLHDKLKIQDINSSIDYSLIADNKIQESPYEAIKIAEMIGVNNELIKKAKYYLIN